MIPYASALAALALALSAVTPRAQTDYRNYEVGQSRPLAVSADGTRLYALHTPDDRLLVYSLQDPASPRLLREIRVGLRPVSIRERNANELWVANRLGDSVSIVDPATGVTKRCLEVGDEPSDICFVRRASQTLAFVSIALEDRIVVLDADTHATVASIPLLGKEPVRLSASPDGKTVYALIQMSGNKTTIVSEKEPTRPAAPAVGPHLPPAPRTGVIVDSDDPAWRRVLGAPVTDRDVFAIDVATLKVRTDYKGVGTILFAMDVDSSGKLWVAGTDARNRVRFEPKLRGHIVDNHVTRIDPSATSAVQRFDLNPGIDYSKLPNDGARASAIAQPTDLVVHGNRIWVSGFGSDRLGMLDLDGKVLARVDIGSNTGAKVDPRQMRGPRGIALHPSAPRLYALNRLRGSLSVVDTQQLRQTQEIELRLNPESAVTRAGRGFLYDAKLSGNGTSSCASCHIDGGIDQLAWDLGDPDGTMFRVQTTIGPFDLHPAKGPLTTQTLKGLKGEAPFHWRGDRPGFADFNPAFDALMGGSQISASDMQAYTSFVETIEHMPNPNQTRNRDLAREPRGESAYDGRSFYTTVFALGTFRCVDCHSLPTGSDKRIFHPLLLQTLQPAKVAPLRTVYRRLGYRPISGERKSGFGLLHEGSEEDTFSLLSRPVFRSISRDAKTKRMLQRFVESFDTGTAPAVGYARTIDAGNAASTETGNFFALMEQQDGIGNIDFVAHGTIDGKQTQLLWDPQAARFDTDRSGVAFTRAQLLSKIGNGQGLITALGVPPGSGRRFALDRDRNQVLDGDEAAQRFGKASPACGDGELDANSAAQIGNEDFAIVARKMTANAGTIFVLASGKAQLRLLDVDLLVDPVGAILVTAPTDTRGTSVLALPIAADTRLRGVRLFTQAFGFATCATQSLEASNGLEIVVR